MIETRQFSLERRSLKNAPRDLAAAGDRPSASAHTDNGVEEHESGNDDDAPKEELRTFIAEKLRC